MLIPHRGTHIRVAHDFHDHRQVSGCFARVTALLSFMLGATETNKGPDVAPAGIVNSIEGELERWCDRCGGGVLERVDFL
jgi:hypothetical protein